MLHGPHQEKVFLFLLEVASNPFKDAGAVIEGVRQNIHVRFSERYEFVVKPDDRIQIGSFGFHFVTASRPSARALRSSSSQRSPFTRRCRALPIHCSSRMPALSSSAPSMTMLPARGSPSRSASSVNGRTTKFRSGRPMSGGKDVPLYSTVPPGSTLATNLYSDGSFMASRIFGLDTKGESISCVARRTWQFDVPERISGP